ncbi:unnamed protein product [Rangifer tarandus platyrhynchus]|uniref:Uncharacterized protein n=2 Tax=Rangifer tarandus platyrhynchus TaxID=3082113 RepID=A0ABN9A236_RANTA|nr:unnamed protein product [Rangifer tarandus platyrhynchus]CAI9713898.1 unnamed protein product [Rangifer tarandus platyrhynchus]
MAVPESPGELPAALPGGRRWTGGGRSGTRKKRAGRGDSGRGPGVGRSVAAAPPLIEPIGPPQPGARRRGRVQAAEIVEGVDFPLNSPLGGRGGREA